VIGTALIAGGAGILAILNGAEGPHSTLRP